MADCTSEATLHEAAIDLADRVAAIAARYVAFFSLDVAETEAGDWILIELNDGQMAAPSENDLDELYGNLRTALDGSGASGAQGFTVNQKVLSKRETKRNFMNKVWQVWNDISERRQADLTANELVVHRVNYFLFNFESGGWLYNLSPSAGSGERWSELRDTAECLAAIGAAEVAEHLREVAGIVERVTIQDAGTWGEFLAKADPFHEIKRLEQTIAREIDETWDRLTEFTVTHFECERD